MIKALFLNIKSSTSIKNGILFTFFATVNNGLNFLLIFILSVYLSKEDFGVLNLFNVLLLIITVIISLGTQSYFGIVYFKKNKYYLNKVLNAIFIISVITFIILIIFIIVFSTFLTNILGFSTIYQIYALIICFFQLFYSINLEIYRLEEKPIQYGMMTLVWLLLNFIITLVFCICFKYGWVGRVDAQVIASLILIVANVVFLRKKGYLKIDFPRWSFYSKVLKFGLPLIPHSSTVWIRQGFDRYIINLYFGATLVGAYSFAYTFSGVIMMIGTAFNATNSVYIYKNLQKNDIEQTRRVLSKQIYIMTFIFLFVTIIGILVGYLIVLFFIPKYTDALKFMIPLGLAAFFQCIYYLFVNYLFYFNKTKNLMYITFSISIVHFACSFFLTRYSVVFTAYLSLISNILICLFVAYFANKTFPLIKKII